MKIKRYYATDMRAALIQVRQEQGPDAVILSNRTTADGVEVIAATDYDENLVRSTLKAFAPAPARSETAQASAAEPAASRDAAATGHSASRPPCCRRWRAGWARAIRALPARPIAPPNA